MFRRAAYFYAGMVILAGFAFWPKYISQPFGHIDLYTHAHAVVAGLWCVLLIAQPLLASRHLAIHRMLGRFSYVLAPAFVVASLLLAHERFRAMDASTFQQEVASLFLPVSAALLFSLAYLLGVYYRTETRLHARFMILTGLPMIDPVLGRVMFFFLPALPHPLLYQAITFGLTDIIVIALLFLPSPARRFRLRYGVPASLFPAAHLLWFTLAQGPSWIPFATWFRELPLP